jgi:tetratricopeptide (TPR) repeat protein
MSEAELKSPIPEWPARLRDMMATYFSLEELTALTFDLGVDYEELGEGGKSSRIMALIRLLARDGRIVALIDQCQALRPQVDWAALRKTASEQPELFVVPAERAAAGYQFSGDFRGATITIVGQAEAQDIEELPPEPGEAPYKGLQYYDEADAAHFYGRELLTALVIGRLAQTRFLAIIGASGSGKSSLVRAGVLPALDRGQRLADDSMPPTNSAQWIRLVMTPSAHPLDSLAATLARDDPSLAAVAELQASLSSNPRTLALAARKLLAQQSRPHLLLVIDQFEEMFSLCRQPEERQAFVDNLVAAVDPDEEGGELTILITLRADFYAQCAQYDSLRQLVSRHQEYIGAMSREELARAIVQPAALGEWRIQEGLVELMLDDAGDEPGALPLLSHALLETWVRRRGRTMTLSGYKESGGVRGAIAQTAEAIFQKRLSEAQRPVARMIFVRLTELGEEENGDTPDTRRRAAFSELITRSTDTATLEAVLAILTEARLIITDVLPPDETKYVEVAHEALIREWPTLRHWLDQDRTDLVRHRQLTADVNDWLKLERDPGAFYRGARLEQMAQWVEAFPEPLSLEEQAFLDGSRAAAAEELQGRERLRRARRLQRVLIGLSAFLLISVIGVAAYVLKNPSQAAQQIEGMATVTPCLPAPMDGDFNVAVAEFVVLAADGRIDRQRGSGAAVSERVYEGLRQALGDEAGVLIWHDSPELAQSHCQFIGTAAADLAGVEAPASMAGRLDADVLVYGVLRPVLERAELQVQFYLAPQFGLDFGNMVGSYGFEMPVPLFDIADPGPEVEAQLEPQVEALARVARGFTRELLGQQAQALADFERAAELAPSAEFVHFFVGQENLFLAQAGPESPEAFEAAAMEAFQRAPDNARARIGLAGIHFIRAQRRLNDALDEGSDAALAAVADEVRQEAGEAVALFSQVVAGGNQLEKYGVAVDEIARVGQGISLRLLGELAFYQDGAAAAAARMDEAAVALETAHAAVGPGDDQRLRAQAVQGLGSVFEWQGYLLAQQGDDVASREAYVQARAYYGQCLEIGERFPFDSYLVAEIVEKLCRPGYERLPES